MKSTLITWETLDILFVSLSKHDAAFFFRRKGEIKNGKHIIFIHYAHKEILCPLQIGEYMQWVHLLL
jgi:hypothetical protein